MDSAEEIMQVCRLCLVKEAVNIPIFDEEGDDGRIFLKISTCLPVKVSKEDNLPKNICDGCSSKLEELYEFWNKSASSEKKLVKWLCQLELDKSDKMQHSMNTSDPVILKQEVVDVAEGDSTGDDLIPEDLNVSNDAPDYMLQQQLPYQPVEIQFQQDGFETTSENSLAEEKETKSKLCKRRAAAMKALASFQSEDEDDADLVNPKIAKTEDPSDESGEEPEPTAFVSLPSGDNEQPGPSGVGKSSNDAPSPGLQPDLLTKYGLKSCVVFLDKAHTLPEEKGYFADRNHISIHSDVIKIDCRYCHRSFQRHNSLFKHEGLCSKNPSKLVSFKCCRRTFTDVTFLCIHVYDKFEASKNATCQPLYSCRRCSIAFNNCMELHDHSIKKHHINVADDVSLKCPSCPRTFDFLQLLRHKLVDCVSESLEDFLKICGDFDAVLKQSTRGILNNQELLNFEDSNSIEECNHDINQNSKDEVFGSVVTKTSIQNEVELLPFVESATEDFDSKNPTFFGNARVGKCEDCGKNFYKLHSYHRHKHIVQMKNICKICKYKTCKLSKLQKHYWERHNLLPFVCL